MNKMARAGAAIIQPTSSDRRRMMPISKRTALTASSHGTRKYGSNIVAAPRDGVVAAVRFALGDLVDEGAELIALDDEDAAKGDR